MGVKNLWDVLESCKKKLPLHHLRNKRVCIDLSCWMVQLQNVNKSYCAHRDKVYLRGLFHRLRALIALNCRVILVTDGAIPGIKLPTYRRRLNSSRDPLNAVTQQGENSENVPSIPRNMGSEFSSIIKEARLLGLALGIPCLEGIEEAEAQCALLNAESLCDGCFTSDSDIFLFGARTVYRDICLGDGGYVVCYEMGDIEAKLGLERNSLIALAILLGSDYTEGVRGVGPESACQIVKSFGEGLLHRIASEGLAFIKGMKKTKKQGKIFACNDKENSIHFKVNTQGGHHNAQTADQLLQVIDAYLKPKCYLADSDAVYRVLGEHPFRRSELQRICHQFFGWPPKKTDEYILPKLAERNLRRFATLRTSSTRGVVLPLHKIPVTCPVSEIIKRRKIRGRDCYEVSWDNTDGLKTSTVLADLVESACPEKIREFNEIKERKRQQNRCKGGRRVTDSISGIDLRLRDLSLGDMGFNTKEQMGRSLSGVEEIDEIYGFSIEEMAGAASGSSTANQSSSESVVINLLSPSPPRGFSACQTSKQACEIHECVEVIDLSDSETDISPEHRRKAREFRLFLSDIRDDIL